MRATSELWAVSTMLTSGIGSGEALNCSSNVASEKGDPF